MFLLFTIEANKSMIKRKRAINYFKLNKTETAKGLVLPQRNGAMRAEGDKKQDETTDMHL